MFRNKNVRNLITTSLLTLLIIFSATFLIYSAEKEIVVLSFNDFHGSLASSGKNVGAAKFVDALKTERAKNPEGTIIVSAGDSYQGSAMSNLLYGEPVSAMFKEAGVELSAVGNHEFDWGLKKSENGLKMVTLLSSVPMFMIREQMNRWIGQSLCNY